MEVWFTEESLPGFRVSAQIKSVVCIKRTKFQELGIFDTVEFGRMLVLDNIIQSTERDEYIYHESLAHVPLFSHPNPEKVLIIGGGDGGTLRETLKHNCVKEATLVDIDGEVIEAAKEYMPQWSTGFSDPRAKVLVANGIDFVRNTDERFDVVLVDSSDPIGPSEALFQPEFYSSIAGVLKPGGMLCAQTESPIAQPELVRDIFGRIRKCFKITRLYTAPVWTYPGGWWSFTCGSLDKDPLTPLRAPEASWNLKFYSPEMHSRMFTLGPKMKADFGIDY